MYSNRKKVLTNSRYARKVKKSRRIFTWLIIILLISTIIAAITALRGPYIRITELEVNIINSDLDKAVYEEKYQDKIDHIKTLITAIEAEQYIYIVPKNTVLTFPGSYVAQKISESEPLFSKVEIQTQNLHGLTVNLTIREPASISCPINSNAIEEVTNDNLSDVPNQPDESNPILSSIGLESETKCAFLDKDGYAYAPAPAFSPGVYVVFLATTTTAFGQHIDDVGKYKQLLDFNDDLKQYGGIIDKVVILSDSEFEIEAVFNQANSPVKILLNSGTAATNSLPIVIDRVIKFVENKYTAHQNNPVKAPSLSSLEYIDGRYGATVYYRYKNE